jgi:hypothetical protein
VFVGPATVDSSDRPRAEATVVGEEMDGWLRDFEALRPGLGAAPR